MTVTVTAQNQSKVKTSNNNNQIVQVGQHQPRGGATFASADFEGGFPPTDWTVIQNNPNETWKLQTTLPITGAGAADVEYDPALVAQDEWLVSPEFYAIDGLVDLNHQGSVFWCRDDNDNCDLDVMLVVDGVGGGDDVLLKTLDEDWTGSFIPVATQVDFTSFIPSSSTPLQIAFRYTGLDGAQTMIDDVIITGTAGGPVTPVLPVPTLSQYGLMLFALLLAVFGYRKIRD